MRIAILSTMRGSVWGGSEELWAATAEAALARGHEVLAYVFRDEMRAPRVKSLQGAGVRFFPRRSLASGRLAGYVYKAVFQFGPLLRANPDVLCVTQGQTYEFLDAPDYRRLAGRLAGSGLPYVVVSHGNPLGYIPSDRTAAASAGFFGGAYRTLFVGPRLVEIVQTQLARKLDNAGVIRNPVNLTDRSLVPWPAGGPASGGPARMAVVSRLTAGIKGHDLLFEALAGDAWRGRDWRLSVFGDGPDRRYLEELAGYFGLGPRVEFAGHVDDVRRVWADHHLLLFSSRTEGLPLAMVEAMLCGRPAVATDVGGIAELVDEPRTGFLAEGASARSIALALERAWAARADWEAIGRRAREAALKVVDEAPGDRLLELLARAAAGRRR